MMSAIIRLRLVFMLCVFLLTACATTPDIDKSTGVDSPAAVNAKLGLSYMQHGNIEVAQAKLEKAIEQDPKLVEAHHYIAELYRRMGDNNLAKKHYRQALDLNPHDMMLQHNFGVFLCQQGDYEEAVGRFVQAAKGRGYSRPDEAYANAGICALRIPDSKRAETYFRQAIMLNKNHASALYNLADINYANGQHLKARAFLQRYQDVASHTPKSLLLGVNNELKMNNHNSANVYARELKEEFPDSEEAAQLDKLDVDW